MYPMFCVLMARIEISVIGGGGGGGCGCASASERPVGGGVWFLGLVMSVSTVTGASFLCVLGVGPSEGDECGLPSRSSESGGEWSNGYSTGGGVWNRILKFGSDFHP